MTESHKTWGDAYCHHKSKGMDQNDAAYRADQWENKQRRKKQKTVRLRNLGDRMIVELDGKEVINTHCPTTETTVDEIVTV